jgi:diguanylate cyclase (GGDEF)-like protein
MSHRLAQSISECHGTDLSMALMLLTVDQLRAIHEAYGVTQSDLLLRQIADRLRALESQSQRVYAIGTNEFGIIFSPTKTIESVNAFADKLLNAVATPFQLQSEQVSISLSVGIALYPEDSNTAEALMDNAHQALISAQDEGGGRANYFEPQRRQQAHLRRRFISDLQHAVAAEKLNIVYQPIIDLKTERLQKAEALIRWSHPERGQISPADFIPLAEQNGALIKVIEEWVFHQVFAALREIRRIQPHFQMSINLSPVHLLHKDFNAQNVAAQLREHGLPGDAVVLEMTEGIMMEMNDELHRRLKALRDSGINLAMDDFGTGYSSLSYLHQFDFQLLKIDQSFVRTLSPKSRHAALCEAIISMGHALGMQVVAEGIESQEHFDFFSQRGCDFGQGYFISYPSSLDALKRMLTEGEI